MDLKNISILKDWDKWTETVGKTVNFSESLGINEVSIDFIAYQIGKILTAVVDPENREERLLQQLWKVGNAEERKNLARLIVKLSKAEQLKQ
jgi:hypothetical protein